MAITNRFRLYINGYVDMTVIVLITKLVDIIKLSH